MEVLAFFVGSVAHRALVVVVVQEKTVRRLGEPSRDKKQREERGFYPMSGEMLMHDLISIAERRYEAGIWRSSFDVNFVCKRLASHSCALTFAPTIFYFFTQYSFQNGKL